jgi:hypothetical protein
VRRHSAAVENGRLRQLVGKVPWSHTGHARRGARVRLWQSRKSRVHAKHQQALNCYHLTRRSPCHRCTRGARKAGSTAISKPRRRNAEQRRQALVTLSTNGCIRPATLTAYCFWHVCWAAALARQARLQPLNIRWNRTCYAVGPRRAVGPRHATTSRPPCSGRNAQAALPMAEHIHFDPYVYRRMCVEACEVGRCAARQGDDQRGRALTANFTGVNTMGPAALGELHPGDMTPAGELRSGHWHRYLQGHHTYPCLLVSPNKCRSWLGMAGRRALIPLQQCPGQQVAPTPPKHAH